jgi:hypothetical protein
MAKGIKMKRTMTLWAAFAAALLCGAPVRAEEARQANALLVVPSGETAFDKKFQDLLAARGAKLLDSYPPSVFVGYIPAALDAELREKYGALVYRDRVDDWGSFAQYGERAVYAVNVWNKRFVEDPPEAPLVVSSDVRQAGRKGEALTLTWNEVMKASSYRLQISGDESFASPMIDALLAANTYRIYPVFWKDGVYFWRVAGILTLNNGVKRDGPFSAAYTFAVSKPARGAKAGPPAPALPAGKRFDKALYWGPSGPFKYYRLQLSETADFAPPLVDVFTDTCTVKISGLPVKRATPYYMRVMGADGISPGSWSQPAEITVVEPPARNTRRRGRK